MLNQIVNRLQGQVRIRVETPFPERVLNLCGARNLAFWDMEWESETAFTCRLNRRDYYALRRAVKQLDCRLTVVRKEGVPFFLGRFRRRHALLAGLTLCSALLFFGSFFIWDFTVEGNQRVTDEEILRALQRQGVGIGTFGISLDTEDIRNHVLLEIPELLWITVNVSGCRAYVEVRERVEAPEPVDEREPTNVVARRDGLILDIQATGWGPVRAARDVGGGGRAADLRRGGHGDRGRPGPDRHGESGGPDLVHPLHSNASDGGGKAVHRRGETGLLPGLWDKSGKILFKQ